MKILLVDEANPIGEPTNKLSGKISMMKSTWDKKYKIEKSSWWKVWKKNKVSLTAGFSFLMNCVDEFILACGEFKELSGEDKKATVLVAIGMIYDYIAKQVMPIWMQPFSGQIKSIVIYVLLSYLIDFMVDKYKNGLWREDESQQEEKQQYSDKPEA